MPRSVARSALALACASLLTTIVPALVPTVAQAQTLEVLHWWTSPAESKAIRVIADAYTAAGGKWVDSAVAGGSTPATQVGMARLAAGDPPGVMQMNISRMMRDLAGEKLLGDISDVSVKGKWAELLPSPVLRGVTVAGKVVAVPVAVHGGNWVFYSPKVLEAAKVAPPKTVDEMLVAAEKIKASGGQSQG